MHGATALRFDGSRRVHDCVQLIRDQFLRTPDLSVTAEQAGRMWGVETPEMEAVLSAFVDANMLNRSRGGAYTLRQDESQPSLAFIARPGEAGNRAHLTS